MYNIKTYFFKKGINMKFKKVVGANNYSLYAKSTISGADLLLGCRYYIFN